MARNPVLSTAIGAVAGALVAIGLLAFFGGATAITTVSAVAESPNSAVVDSVFVATQGAMWLLILFCGALGGLVLAALTYAFGRIQDPAAVRFPFRFVAPGSMLLAAAMSYATVRLGAGIAGDITIDGVVTVPVTAMVVIVTIAGLVAGATTMPIVDALTRPVSIGPRNEATPISSRAFWVDLMGAIGVPVLAATIVASLAIGFSQLLLSSGSAVVAVVAFGGAAAIILGATTLIALRPWERR